MKTRSRRFWTLFSLSYDICLIKPRNSVHWKYFINCFLRILQITHASCIPVMNHEKFSMILMMNTRYLNWFNFVQLHSCIPVGRYVARLPFGCMISTIYFWYRTFSLDRLSKFILEKVENYLYNPLFWWVAFITSVIQIGLHICFCTSLLVSMSLFYFKKWKFPLRTGNLTWDKKMKTKELACWSTCSSRSRILMPMYRW